MTAKRKKTVWFAGGILGLLILLLIASLNLVQTQWFSDLVRSKVIAALEDSTGGRVEIAHFHFYPSSLTAQIDGLVLHGTEPKNVPPLARIARLELRLKLLSGFRKILDLAYLAVESPQVNIIANPDGTTNIPEPKVKNSSNAESPLKTVVDLAVGEFRLDNGSISYGDTQMPLNVHGDNLRVSLDYNLLRSSYIGSLKLDGIRITSKGKTPLLVRLDLPIEIRENGVATKEAVIRTDRSQVRFSASLENPKEPNLSLAASAKVFLPEFAETFGMPLATKRAPSLSFLTADLNAGIDEHAHTVTVPRLQIALGKALFNATGTANAASGSSIHFDGNLALAELTDLFEINSPKVQGDLAIRGNASIDRNNTYAIRGDAESHNLSLRQGDIRFTNVSLATPFRITPNLISVDALKIGLLGSGQILARASLTALSKLNCQGDVRGISLANLSAALAARSLNYAGLISGKISAAGDLKARTPNLDAKAALTIAPAGKGIPVRGRLDVLYAGANQFLNLTNTYIALPASRLDIDGSPKKTLTVNLTSRNLDDFLPLTKLSNAKRTALPVRLQHGIAAVNAGIEGALSSPQISAHVEVTNFVAQGREFDDLSLNATASPSGVQVQAGELRRKQMRVAFDASARLVQWRPVSRSPVSGNVTVRNADLGDLLALSGVSDPGSQSDIEADIHLAGTYADPLGSLQAQFSKGVAMGQPFDGASARLNLTHQLVTLSAFNLETAGGKIALSGTYRHSPDNFAVGSGDVHLQSHGVDLSKVTFLQKQDAGIQGVLDLTTDLSGQSIGKSNPSHFRIADLKLQCSANRLRVENQDAGNFNASAYTSAGSEIYTVRSNFAGSSIQLDGRTSLTPDYSTNAKATVRNLPVERALLLTGQSDVPISGLLTANADVSGNAQAPDVTLRVNLERANVYQEPVNRLSAQMSYNNDLIQLSSLNLSLPAGSLTASGRYDRLSNADTAKVRVHIASSDLDLAKLKRLQLAEPELAGKLRLAADAEGSVPNNSTFVLSNVTGDIHADSLRMANQPLGNLTASARTQQSVLAFHLDSDLAQSELHLQSSTQLAAGYPTKANVSFKNVRYRNFAPFLAQDSDAISRFDALIEGDASVDGPLTKYDALTARLQLAKLQLLSNARSAGSPQQVQLQNDQPIVVSLNRQKLNVERFNLTGRGTTFHASGGVDFSNNQSALQLVTDGTVDLAILQELDRDFYSSGKIALNTKVVGNLTQPSLDGQITLQNASVNYAGVPNGLSNANGVIALTGSSALIKNLTAESGGGKIEVSGSAGLSPRAVLYNLRARASHVRTRYDDASITSSAKLSFTGSSRRSLLSGSVVVERIAYSSSSDLGSLLSEASMPPSTSSETAPFLAAIRLDVVVTTSSDLRVSTSYVEKLQVNSHLNLLGTAAEPGVQGHINITDGQLVFFGNAYTVNTGNINFYDPTAIRPELNFALETVAQGVDVTLGVTGPVSDMKLTYRSDPPLTFQQIVQLLATNTTPSDPTIAAHQPTPPQQSLSQMGESQILGEAVANPLASRAQRIFGLSEFRIDPTISGSNGQPSAKITLQQKIANNITFTYINDVTQSNSEIVRVQWDLNSKTSAVALRDYNGNVSVQLFYRFQVR